MERFGEAEGGDARRFERGLWVHAVIDQIDDKLHHRLRLHVAAGGAIG